MKSPILLIALSALSGLVAATNSTGSLFTLGALDSSDSSPTPNIGFFNKRSSREHPEISKRQAVPGKKAPRYGTVVAKSPFKLVGRDALNSPSVPTQARLTVSSSSGALLGYVTPSTTFPGDFTYVNDLTKATAFSLTLATNDVQNLPIVNPPSGVYPYLAGVAGGSNTGSNSPPYIPSTDFGGDGSANGQNYAYLSSAQNVPYGPAQQVPNGDNSTPYAETGMFQLSGTGLQQLVPVWVNNDKSVVPNQQFGLDSSNSLIMYGSQTAVNSAYGTITPVTIGYVV